MPYKRKREENKMVCQKKHLAVKNKRWVVEREQTLDGITDLESCLKDMKRRLRTTLVWCRDIMQYHYL
jgi:hypothetical protein